MQSTFELFQELVRIDSPTGEEAALRKHLAELFSIEGGSAETDESGNLLIRVPGNAGDHESLLFSAHLDTVEPGRGIQVQRNPDGSIVSDGRTILGADDKDGIAAILQAFRKIVKKRVSHPPLEFLFTVGEENNLAGAAHIRSGWLRAKRGWIFDGPGSIGTIYRNGTGKIGFKIKLEGRSAHAALNPEGGINAMAVFCTAFQKIPPGHHGNATLNYGTVSGGTADNIVPGAVEVTGEIRSNDSGERDALFQALRNAWTISAGEYGCSIHWIRMPGYPSFALPPDSEHYKQTCEICKNLGIMPELKTFHAACDANCLSRLGIDLCIIGTGRKFNHSTRESTSCSNLETLTDLAFAFMSDGTS